MKHKNPISIISQNKKKIKHYEVFFIHFSFQTKKWLSKSSAIFKQ